MSQLLDPSLEEDFAEIYQTQKSFKINNKIKSFDDTLMVRIFKSNSCYKIELTSENNICFLYSAEISEASLSTICSRNNLTLEYHIFFDWLKHIFNENFAYEFLLTSKESGQLKIFKQETYKNYLVAVLPFEMSSVDRRRENITYRFQRMKVRKQMLTEYWQKMNGIIKTKNPSLFLSLENKKQKKVFK